MVSVRELAAAASQGVICVALAASSSRRKYAAQRRQWHTEEWVGGVLDRGGVKSSLSRAFASHTCGRPRQNLEHCRKNYVEVTRLGRQLLLHPIATAYVPFKQSSKVSKSLSSVSQRCSYQPASPRGVCSVCTHCRPPLQTWSSGQLDRAPDARHVSVLSCAQLLKVFGYRTGGPY